MALDPFNKIKVEQLSNELTATKEEFLSYQSKSAQTFSQLENMIAHEQGFSMSEQRLWSEYAKIGDPYNHNIFVKKAIDKIAESIAGAPWYLSNARGDQLSDSNPWYRLFNYISNTDSPYDFMFEIIRQLQLTGKVFVRKIYVGEYNPGKVPAALDVLPSKKVKAVKKDGILQGWEYKIKDGKKIFSPEEILFIRIKHPEDDYDGLPPGSAAVKEILQDFYAQMYNIKYFQQGAQGKGVWRTQDGYELTAKQQQEAQYAADQTFNKGIDSAHKEFVVKRPLEYIRTSDSQRDMEFQTLLDKMRDRILVVYDIPKVLFASAEATFTNLKEAKKMFWTQTLHPIMQKIEDAFNTNFLPDGVVFHFAEEEIPELQDDLGTKMETAVAMYNMGIPVSVIDEALGLGLSEYEGWDQPANQTFSFEAQQRTVKSAIEEYKKSERLEQEKAINHDKIIQDAEYKVSLRAMLEEEKDFSNAVEGFFDDTYQLIKDYLDKNEIKSVNKSLVDPDWIEQFKHWLRNLSLSTPFVEKLTPFLEKTFNRGRYRSYWGLGADFQQRPELALRHIINRGLKLQGAPDVVKETIIHHLESNAWTVDELAKEISKKWKDASKARAKVIAQTETTAAYNGGRLEGMKELGIKKKQWIHSSDAKVRDSHRINDVVLVDEAFKLADGYNVQYPGDGDPSHAANCRCVVVSYLD